MAPSQVRWTSTQERRVSGWRFSPWVKRCVLVTPVHHHGSIKPDLGCWTSKTVAMHGCAAHQRMCDLRWATCDGLLYTHSCVARTFCMVALCTTTCVRTRMAQGYEQKLFGWCMGMSFLPISPFSILMSHPCPSLLFPYGEPCWSAADVFSSCNGDEEFGYLAKSARLTGYEPKQLDKMVTADDDSTPINDPDHDSISDFSKTTHWNTGWFCFPTVCETSVSQVSRGDIALQHESKESLTRETEGKQRQREERHGSVMSVGESMSRESRRNIVRSHSHQTHRDFYSDERDLREHLERRAQQAIHGENSARRKLYKTEYNVEIQNSERRKSEYALFESQRELDS